MKEMFENGGKDMRGIDDGEIDWNAIVESFVDAVE